MTSKIRVLFNCSNNVVGGAIQNAANFIRYAVQDKSIEYRFIVSKQVKGLLDCLSVQVYSLDVLASPASSKDAREKGLKIESDFNPHLVYTMAGPTYIKFKKTHIMGVSDPYITHSKISNFKNNRSIIEFSKFFMKIAFKAANARLGADFFLFQTETSRNGFCKRFWWPQNKTSIVPNAVGDGFLKGAILNEERLDQKSATKEVKILCPSAYYPHKNLELVIKLAKLFRDDERIKFILTIPKSCKLGIELVQNPLSNVENIGPYSYSEAGRLYREADIVIMPSLLETFSTTYIEAIAARKPIVVADTEFSREICDNYANYYFKSEPQSAYAAICEVIDSGFDVNVEIGTDILSKYGTQADRYNRIKKIILDVKERV